MKTTTNQWLDDHSDAVNLSDLGPCDVHVDFWPVDLRDAVYLSDLGPCGAHVDFCPGMTSSVTADTKQIRFSTTLGLAKVRGYISVPANLWTWAYPDMF